jgi:hypothetical protein
MRYLLLIYDDERVVQAMSEAERAALFTDYRAFSDSIRASGAFLGGNPLEPVRTATTVRMKNGKTVATDGPFAETREQLGGYYMVEAKDRDEAIAIASRIPSVRHGGSIEVRPVMELGQPR